MANENTALARVQQTAVEPFEPQNLEQAFHLAKDIAESQLVPAHLRGKPYDVYVTLLYGRDLGLTPLQAVFNIDMVKGRPRLNSFMTAAQVKKSPVCKYFRMIESTDAIATFETWRVNYPEPERLSFTAEQARKARLLSAPGKTSESAWDSQTAAMLRRRASQLLAREVYPDVVGNVLDDDEVEEMLGRNAIEATIVAPPPRPAPPAAGPAPAAASKPVIEVSAPVAPTPKPARQGDWTPSQTEAERAAIERARAEDNAAVERLGAGGAPSHVHEWKTIRDERFCDGCGTIEPVADRDVRPANVSQPAAAPPPTAGAPAAEPDDLGEPRAIDRVRAEFFRCVRERAKGKEKALAELEAIAIGIKPMIERGEMTGDERKVAVEALRKCRAAINEDRDLAAEDVDYPGTPR